MPELMAQQSAPSTLIEFETKKMWNSGRWILIGSLRGGSVFWSDGPRTRLSSNNSSSECKSALVNSDSFNNDSSEEILEIGRNSQGWIFVEVDPQKESALLKVDLDGGCTYSGKISWSLGPKKTRNNSALSPFLFLKPIGTRFSQYTINFKESFLSPSADIVLDVLFGVGTFSALSDDLFSVSSLPLQVAARGEWSPSGFGGVGFELQMAQTIRVLAEEFQNNLFMSDWMAGAYYQYSLPVQQGLVLRAHLDYFEHLVDRGMTFTPRNAIDLRQIGIGIGFSSVLYFAKKLQWLVRVDYAPDSRMTGLGVDQSRFSFRSHMGFLLTESVSILFEGSMDRFSVKGLETNKVYHFKSGVRLEL